MSEHQTVGPRLSHGLALLAVVAALGLGAILIRAAGVNPWVAYRVVFREAFFDRHGLSTTLVKFGPLLLTGLAVLVPLRAGLLNIGGEGQMYLGGLAGAAVALHAPALPAWLLVPLCLLAGAGGGLAWAMIPALFRAYRGTNEVILTLLLNYVAMNLVSALVAGPMMEPDAPYPYSREIPRALWLPGLPGTSAHAGVVLALAICAVVAFVLSGRTITGVSLRVIGRAPDAAQHAGLPVKHSLVFAMAVGGACAGVAGAIEVLGSKHRLYHSFVGGYGYDGVAVAFLAGGSPAGCAVAALFLAGLHSGANAMQRAVAVPQTVVEVLQGLVLVMVAVVTSPRLSQWLRPDPARSREVTSDE